MSAARVRRFAFIAVAAWMLLAPAYVQVLGGEGGSVRAWRMFHKRGKGICAAVYYDRGQRVDRYALFEVERAKAPAAFRRIADERSAREMGRQLCARIGAGADVRVELRCGTKKGMKPVLDREESLCGS